MAVVDESGPRHYQDCQSFIVLIQLCQLIGDMGFPLRPPSLEIRWRVKSEGTHEQRPVFWAWPFEVAIHRQRGPGRWVTRQLVHSQSHAKSFSKVGTGPAETWVMQIEYIALVTPMLS